MAKTAKRRRKEAKARRSAARKGPRQSDRTLVESAGRWPVLEVLVSRDWAKCGQLVQILVARRAPSRTVVAGAFAVDLACLGVKSAFAAVLFDEPAYRRDFRARMTSVQPMDTADLDLAAKIVREGLRYARSFGFAPDPDFRLARRLLDGADPDACTIDVPLGGTDGKPLYIAGPYDDPDLIMRGLEGRLGPDGFHFIAPL